MSSSSSSSSNHQILQNSNTENSTVTITNNNNNNNNNKNIFFSSPLLFRVSVIFLLFVLIYKSSGVGSLWNFTLSQTSNSNNNEDNANNGKENEKNKLPPSLAAFASSSNTKIRAKAVVDLSSSVYKLSSSNHAKLVAEEENTNDTTNGGGAPQQQQTNESISTTGSSFHAFASDLIENHLSEYLQPGTFDLDLLLTLSKAQAENFEKDPSGTSVQSSLLPCKEEAATAWNIDLRRSTNIAFPSCLSTWKKSLSTVKFYISLALSKLVHDEELERVYVAILNTIDEANHRGETKVENAARNALHSFKFSTAKIISAQVHHLITVVQNLADGFRPSFQDDKRIFLINEFVNAPIFISDDATMMQKKKFAKNKNNSKKASSASSTSAIERWLSNRIKISLTSILQDSPSVAEFNGQNPVEGKFWNLVRNDIGCSSLERSCETPEGCRYLCNREYLLRGGNLNKNTGVINTASCLSASASGRARKHSLAKSVTDAIFGISSSSLLSIKPDQSDKNANQQLFQNCNDECVQLISLGSNNEFDWEDSMTKLIRTAGAPFAGIATFDCTLSLGVKPSPTMQQLTKTDGKLFSFFPLCMGVADEKTDSVAKRKHVDELLKKSSGFISGNVNSSSSSSSSFSIPLSRRLLQNEGGKVVSIAELDILLKEVRTRQPVKVYPNYNQVDNEDEENVFEKISSKVSILKMDVESFEFVAVPRWLQVEMSLIGKQLVVNQKLQQQQQSANNSNNNNKVLMRESPLVDFSALPGMITVEQLQTEIHRRGHKNKKGSTFVGALWLQWLMLNYHALGFVSVANEKNHVDNCCFEAVFVNYRYYIASETWYSATVA